MSEQFDEARQIDQACDAFEAAWNADHSVRIEPYLDSLTKTDRQQALTALLLLELELRNTTGPLPSLEETARRFPDDRTIILYAYRDAESYASDKQLPEKLGHYRVEYAIGRGTFGTVYRAFDLQLRRIVALKVLHRWYSESKCFVDRFKLEAQAAADLSDPNICQVLDIGFAEGRHYYAMRYCDGENLAEALFKRGALPVTEAIDLVVKLARALDRMHQRGLIHRDLKPANVLISNGEPMVTDFGLSHDGENALTNDPLEAAGTPAYMAPEQFRGPVAASPAQDIYSLGAILFELITGKRPAIAAESKATELKKEEVESTLVGIASPKLIAVCKQALNANPENRFGSAREFADALENSTRSRKQIAFAGVGVTCLLLVGLVVYWNFGLTNRTSSAPDNRITVPSTVNEPYVSPTTEPRPNRAEEKSHWAKRDLYERDWTASPPALSDWLEGREILTVAQDGSAMYNTISAALAMVQPKQVVKVLDKGPYRERLNLKATPYLDSATSRCR